MLQQVLAPPTCSFQSSALLPPPLLPHHKPPITFNLPSSQSQKYYASPSPQGLCLLTAPGRAVEDGCPLESLPFFGEHGHCCNESLQKKDLLKQEGILTANEVYDFIYQCLPRIDLATCKEAYCLVCRNGLEADNFLGNHLISMLSETGSLLEASRVFIKLPNPDVFAWCAIISAYAENGYENQAISIYYEMQQSLIELDGHVFRVVLKACANAAALRDGRIIHVHMIECAIECNIFVGSALIDMYAKCGSLDDAHGVFADFPEQDLVTWSTMLAGYARHGHGQEALELFHQMQEEGLKPGQITFMSVLKACSSIPSLDQGQLTHSSIIYNGFETNVYLVNTLVDMYAKCGSFEDARIVFHRLQSRDVSAWNVMIGACAQHGRLEEAVYLFHHMQCEGVNPGQVTFVNILKACADFVAIDEGRLIHADATQCGFESDMYVGSTLVDIYAKCGYLQDARALFEKLPSTNAVTWGAMISGYAQCGLTMEAFLLFQQMQEVGIELDQAIFISILKACTSLSSLDQGHAIHVLALESDFECDTVVSNALTSMYATCGSIDDACLLFNRLPNRNTMTWNALISGLALNQHEHVHGQKALRVFQQMLAEAVEPDQVTFISILKVCSRLSALNQGSLIHALVVESGLELDVLVGNTLINMYAKCGSLDNACCLFNRLPVRDTVTLNIMIEGFGLNGHANQALCLFEQMQKKSMKVVDVTFMCLLSACSHNGFVKEGFHYFKLMKGVYGIVPKIDHYNLMVDLIGRAGFLSEAEDLLQTMPCQTDFAGWMSLLTHCKQHGNVDVGRRCFNSLVALDRENASGYVLMSSIYAHAGMWEAAERLEELRKGTTGALKKPGKAFIEIGNKVHEFIVGGTCHPQSDAVYAKLKELTPQMKNEGYVPQLDLVHQWISDAEKETALCGHCEKLAIAFGLLNTAEGATIRVSKNLRVCSDCHNAIKVVSKIEKREIYIMDAYRIHRFQGGNCSCKDFY